MGEQFEVKTSAVNIISLSQGTKYIFAHVAVLPKIETQHPGTVPSGSSPTR